MKVCPGGQGKRRRGVVAFCMLKKVHPVGMLKGVKYLVGRFCWSFFLADNLFVGHVFLDSFVGGMYGGGRGFFLEGGGGRMEVARVYIF